MRQTRSRRRCRRVAGSRCADRTGDPDRGHYGWRRRGGRHARRAGPELGARRAARTNPVEAPAAPAAPAPISRRASDGAGARRTWHAHREERDFVSGQTRSGAQDQGSLATTADPMNTDWPGRHRRTDIGTQIYPGSVQFRRRRNAPSAGVPTPPGHLHPPRRRACRTRSAALAAWATRAATGRRPPTCPRTRARKQATCCRSPSPDWVMWRRVGGAIGGLGSALGGLRAGPHAEPGIPGQTATNACRKRLPRPEIADSGGAGCARMPRAQLGRVPATHASSSSPGPARTARRAAAPWPWLPRRVAASACPGLATLWDGSRAGRAVQVGHRRAAARRRNTSACRGGPNQIGGARRGRMRALGARQQAGNTLRAAESGGLARCPIPRSTRAARYAGQTSNVPVDPGRPVRPTVRRAAAARAIPTWTTLGAGDNLGQTMLPPPGGTVPPVPPDAIVGMGHQFGEDTGDETPFHKGVDYQADAGHAGDLARQGHGGRRRRSWRPGPVGDDPGPRGPGPRAEPPERDRRPARRRSDGGRPGRRRRQHWQLDGAAPGLPRAGSRRRFHRPDEQPCDRAVARGQAGHERRRPEPARAWAGWRRRGRWRRRRQRERG